MQKVLILIFIWTVLFFPLSLLGQEKYEEEDNISVMLVPQKAQDFIKSCPFSKRIKWFKEKSHEGITYEAKTKYQKHRYSIEFSPKGKIQDIEKTVHLRKMDEHIRQKITNALDEYFDKYKIIKTQIQWKASDKKLIDCILKQKNELVSTAYELVIKARKDKVWESYEVLISEEGLLLKTLKIVERDTDNLEF